MVRRILFWIELGRKYTHRLQDRYVIEYNLCDYKFTSIISIWQKIIYKKMFCKRPFCNLHKDIQWNTLSTLFSEMYTGLWLSRKCVEDRTCNGHRITHYITLFLHYITLYATMTNLPEGRDTPTPRKSFHSLTRYLRVFLRCLLAPETYTFQEVLNDFVILNIVIRLWEQQTNNRQINN